METIMKPPAKSRRTTDRKLRLCVVFDEPASAVAADVMIRHVASDCQYETSSFHFDELDAPAPGIAAARSASDTDILVVAVRNDKNLPAHMRLWIGLCLGMRNEHQDGALVALIIQAGKVEDLDSSLVDYLQTVAIIGGLTFFVKRRSACGRRRVSKWLPTKNTNPQLPYFREQVSTL
jgi:hypothetical protein